MAEDSDDAEKTEEASERKLRQAYERGDVPKSQEVSTWFMILASTIIVATMAAPVSQDIAAYLRGFVANADQIPVDGGALPRLAISIALAMGAALALPMLLLVIAAIAGNVVQHGFLFTFETIQPKLQKISPLAGFKRLFSGQSLVNFAKGLAKLAIVGVIMVLVVWPDQDRFDTLVSTNLPAVMDFTLWLAIKLMVATAAILTVIAALDWMYTRHTYMKRQRMTMREVRDEYKQAEGDPIIKAKLRQVRAERSRQRMMQRVPEASVIITNPTHFAVALKYDEGMAAPVCIAKGIDAVALRIREVGKENDVAIVEDPPLARALHASVEIDDVIEPEYYRAVANIIGYVMRKKNKPAWRA
jgi:flagellar biosynthetic protein FlhB